jgi:hypothetical protein
VAKKQGDTHAAEYLVNEAVTFSITKALLGYSYPNKLLTNFWSCQKNTRNSLKEPLKSSKIPKIG